MRAVDTNVLVRLVVRDDPKQVAAAEQFVSSGGWVSLLVLMEMTWVLDSVSERGPTEISIAVDMLLNHMSLSVQDADVVAAAVEQFRTQPAPGFSDCLVLEVARKAGHLPLGTFGRRLARVRGAERL